MPHNVKGNAMTKPNTKAMTADEIAALPDRAIDFTDIAELDEEFWRRAQIVTPDQTRMNAMRESYASEVMRDALRLTEDRERKLAALEAAMARGMNDTSAGRVRDADDVFASLASEIAALPDQMPV